MPDPWLSTRNSWVTTTQIFFSAKIVVGTSSAFPFEMGSFLGSTFVSFRWVEGSGLVFLRGSDRSESCA